MKIYLNLKTTISDYQLYKLEQNYRSTQMIVNAANTIIANNEGQIQKNVFSMNEAGEKIAGNAGYDRFGGRI